LRLADKGTAVINSTTLVDVISSGLQIAASYVVVNTDARKP
jgi:hypothetical protein